MLTLYTIPEIRAALLRNGMTTTNATIRADCMRGVLAPIARTVKRQTRLFTEEAVEAYVAAFSEIREAAEARSLRGGHV